MTRRNLKPGHKFSLRKHLREIRQENLERGNFFEDASIKWEPISEELEAFTNLKVHGVTVPREMHHWITNPYGYKGRRDGKLVSRIQRWQERARTQKYTEKDKDKTPSRRNLQLSDLFLEKLNYILTEELQYLSSTLPPAKGLIISPVLAQALVRFSEVDIIGDLSRAVCTWECMPGFEEKVRDQLNNIKSVIRKRLAELIRIKFMPKLEFRFNEKSIQIDKLETALDQMALDPLLQKFKNLRAEAADEVVTKFSKKGKKIPKNLPKIPNYRRKVQPRSNDSDSLGVFPVMPLKKPEE
jgi:ribosome-binding factor A